MLRLEDAIRIDQTLPAVYRMVSDIEQHVSLLPGYLESKIVERRGEVCVVSRVAIIHGRRRQWTSEVRFEPERALHFQQMEGPLKGMRILWELSPEDQGTRLRIVHDMDIRPRWKGWWMERVIAKPAIVKTARLVLEAIKKSAERPQDAS